MRKVGMRGAVPEGVAPVTPMGPRPSSPACLPGPWHYSSPCSPQLRPVAFPTLLRLESIISFPSSYFLLWASWWFLVTRQRGSASPSFRAPRPSPALPHPQTFLIHSSISGHLGCLQVLAIVNNAAVIMGCRYLSELVLCFLQVNT